MLNWLIKRTRCTNETAEGMDRLAIAKSSASHHRIEAQRFRDFAARAAVDAENSDRLAALYEKRVREIESSSSDGVSDSFFPVIEVQVGS